jgi:hypothetical protein
MSPEEFARMVEAVTRRYCVLARYRNPEKEAAARLDRQARNLAAMSDFGKEVSLILHRQGSAQSDPPAGR